MSGICAIVLAAGASVRMGRPKMLLPFGEATVLKSTLAAVTASSVDSIVVVTGANAELIEASLIGEEVSIARNPDFTRGNMSSFVAGVDAEPNAASYVLTAGDLPTLATDAVEALCASWRLDGPWAAVAEYEDRVAHPFLLSSDAVDEVRGLGGSKVLWRTLVAPGDPRVVRVAVPSRAPVDVNTEAEYEASRRDASGPTPS